MSLSWGLDDIAESASFGGAAPASPEASPSLLSSTALGKSTGTGGYGGKLVNLRLVRLDDAVCFGYIGATRSKICLVENCGVQAHQQLKFQYENAADALVFIESGSPHTVWARPCVDVAIFGAAWETYRFETRKTTSWQTLFNAIKAAPFMSLDEVIHIGKATKASDLMFTPHKRRHLAGLMASPTESETSFQDVTFVPLVTDPGLNEEVSMSSVLRQWKTVGNTLKLLHSMAASAKKGNKELDDLLSQSVTLMEAKLGGLRAVIGERHADLGTQTVFGELAHQATELSSIRSTLEFLVKRLRTADADKKDEKRDLKAKIFTELLVALRPLQLLFGVLSSTMTTRSDKLHKELATLKASVSVLEAKVGSSAGTIPPVNVPLPLH
jgi:hypothetical protein